MLHLINENKTLNEISAILGLSNKQIFTRLSMLRNAGYLLEKEYNYNGNIRYSIANPFLTNNSNSNELNIKISEDIRKTRMLITSDLHLGNQKENIKAIHAMMEYCIKEKIHIILNAGDFFQGIYQNSANIAKITDEFEQIQYGLSNYPSDKNIFTVTCLGNHDASFWTENGIDIKSLINDRRHDIVALGYGAGVVNINNNRIILNHPIDRCKFQMPLVKRCLYVIGHSHSFKIYDNPDFNRLDLYAPCLSNVEVTSNLNPIPSFIDAELNLTNQGISHERFQQFVYVNNNFIKVGEIDYNMLIYKDSTRKEITGTFSSSLKPKLPSSIEEITQRITTSKLENIPVISEKIPLSSDKGQTINIKKKLL